MEKEIIIFQKLERCKEEEFFLEDILTLEEVEICQQKHIGEFLGKHYGIFEGIRNKKTSQFVIFNNETLRIEDEKCLLTELGISDLIIKSHKCFRKKR